MKTGQFEGGAAFVDGAHVPLSEAKISLFDWGFTRSDATCGVASVWKGAFFRLDAHVHRFFASLDKLRLRIPIRLGPIQIAELRQADDVFLTSTGGGVLPIAKVDGLALRHLPGPITTPLYDAYWAMHDEEPYRDPVRYE